MLNAPQERDSSTPLSQRWLLGSMERGFGMTTYPTGEQIVHQPALDVAQIGDRRLFGAEARVVRVQDRGDAGL